MHLSNGVSDKLQSEEKLLAVIRALPCKAKVELFWESTLERCSELGISGPKEHCPHKLPRQIDENRHTAAHMSAKDKESLYFNVSYLVVSMGISLLSPVQQVE